MKIEEIQELWEKDSEINPLRMEEESLKISKLHSKYYGIYIKESIRLEQMSTNLKDFYKERWKFYNKMQPKEAYDERFDDSFFDKKLLKEDRKIFIDADEELTKEQMKVHIQSEKVKFLDSIIKTISNRNFTIKNYIDYMKYANGF